MSMWKEWIKGLLGIETSVELNEIGHDSEGEMSEESLRTWIKWAIITIGICLITVSAMAAVASVRNRKEAAILEVDSGTVLEFYLNRKGTILKAKGDASEVLNDHSLEEGIEKILQGVSEHGHLGEDGAVIFTLRSSESGISADLERFANGIHVYAESFLRKKHSDGKVYVHVLEGEEISGEMAQEYGVSLGKASLVQDLVRSNRSLGSGDVERLIRMSVDELSAEITERKYDTSFIVVVAKQVYAMMIETEPAIEETTAEIPETTVAEETVKATAAASNVVERTEAPAETMESETEAVPESEAEEGVEGTSEEETVEANAEGDANVTESAVETAAEETSPAETESVAPETQPETQASETNAASQPETQATEAVVQPETQAAEAVVQPETLAPTEAPTEPETSAPAQPETVAPQETQPTGSIIEQVIPLTPAG